MVRTDSKWSDLGGLEIGPCNVLNFGEQIVDDLGADVRNGSAATVMNRYDIVALAILMNGVSTRGQ